IERDGSGTERTYLGRVYYKYTVAGKEYQSKNRVHSDHLYTGSLTRAEEVIARYPEGKKVEVFYDPQQPSVAVLEPGNISDLWVICLIGGIFSCVGFVLLGASIHSLRKKRK